MEAIEKAANDAKLDPQSSEARATIARANQLVKDRDNQRSVCFNSIINAPAPMPAFNPGPLQPVQGAPQINDTGTLQQSSSGVDCTKLRAAYDSLGPVASTADAIGKLDKLKLPGISQEGTSLAFAG